MNEEAREPRTLPWTWICGLSSVVLCVALLEFAIRIRLTLGRWPNFGEEFNSPVLLAHQFLLIGGAIFAAYIAAPLWLLLICFHRFRRGVGMHFLQALLFGLGWLLVDVVFKYGPQGFIYWLRD